MGVVTERGTMGVNVDIDVKHGSRSIFSTTITDQDTQLQILCFLQMYGYAVAYKCMDMDTTEQSRQSCVITQRRTKHANPLAPGPRNTTTVTTLQARNRRRVDYGPVEPPGLLVAVSVAVFS
ncbi:hypothetical protein CSPX01_14261 [Colletotrichum filicis]|nr:hypothetical protein CSPX01_14261 [Colletotrichum filicis]